MKFILALPVSWVLILASGSALSAEVPREAASLNRPSMQSEKASSSVALLAVTRAGARTLAAGERGIVVYSDDDGVNWKQAQTPTNASITAMQFVDAKLGWAVGHMGIVLHTTDGGQTWVKQFDGVQAAQRMLAVARPSGDEHALREAERMVADGADKPFLDLYFVSERTGYVIGAYNMIFRTDDGGASWTPWQSHLSKVNPKGLHLYGIRGIGASIFIVGEQGLLLRSKDFGEHFETIPSPYAGSWFGLTATGNAVVVYGLRGNAYRSGDDGKSWQRLATETPATISSGSQLSDGRLVLVTQAGEVLVSANQGDSFARVPGAARLPLAALGEVSGGLVLASLRGVQTLVLPKP